MDNRSRFDDWLVLWGRDLRRLNELRLRDNVNWCWLNWQLIRDVRVGVSGRLVDRVLGLLDCFHWDLNRYRLNLRSWNKRLRHRRQWVASTVQRSQPTLLVSLSRNWFVRVNLIIDLVAQWCVCRVVISTGVGCWLCWLRWGFVDWLLYGRVMISDWWLLHGRVMISDRLYNRCRVILHRFMNNRCRFLDNLM